jgi:hypothetical protein
VGIVAEFKAKLGPALKSDGAQRELTGFIKKKIQDQRAFLDCLWQFAMGFSTEWERVKQNEKQRGLALLYTLFGQAIELAASTNELADFVVYVAGLANEMRGGKKDSRPFRLPPGEEPEQYRVYASRWGQLPANEQRELQARAQKKRQQRLDRRTLITYLLTAYRKAKPENPKPSIEDLYDFDVAPNARRQELDTVMQECDSAWRSFSRAGKVPNPPNEKNLEQLDRAFKSLRVLLLDTGDNMPAFYQLWKWIRDGRTRNVRRGYSWGEQYTETVQSILYTVWIEMYLEACYCAIRLAVGKWSMGDLQRAHGLSADDRDFILQAVSENERANFTTRLTWGVKNTIEFEELNRIRRRMNRFGAALGMDHLDEFQTTSLANEIARINDTNPAVIDKMVVQSASQWVAFRDKFRIGQTVLDSFGIVWSMETPAGPRVIVEFVKFPWQPFAVTNDKLGDLVRDAVWRKMQELSDQVIAFLLAYLEVVGMVVDVITAGASGGLRRVAFEFAKERLKDKLTDEMLDAFHVENPALRTLAGFVPNLVPRGKVKVHVEPSVSDVGGDLARTEARAVATAQDATKAEAKAIDNIDVHAKGVDARATQLDAPTATGVDTRAVTTPTTTPWVAQGKFGTDPARPGWTHQKVQQQQTKVKGSPEKGASDPRATVARHTDDARLTGQASREGIDMRGVTRPDARIGVGMHQEAAVTGRIPGDWTPNDRLLVNEKGFALSGPNRAQAPLNGNVYEGLFNEQVAEKMAQRLSSKPIRVDEPHQTKGWRTPSSSVTSRLKLQARKVFERFKRTPDASMDIVEKVGGKNVVTEAHLFEATTNPNFWTTVGEDSRKQQQVAATAWIARNNPRQGYSPDTKVVYHIVAPAGPADKSAAFLNKLMKDTPNLEIFWYVVR